MRKLIGAAVAITCLLAPAVAAAQTAEVAGSLTWDQLTNLNVKSVAVVFVIDADQTSPVITASVGPLSGTQVQYSASLTVLDEWAGYVILADCPSDPVDCGTPPNLGTRLVYNFTFAVPLNSTPLDLGNVDLTSDLSPITISGSIEVDNAVFESLDVNDAPQPNIFDNQIVPGVYSATSVTAPASSYMVLAQAFAFPQVFDWTLTLGQTTFPTCPPAVDIQRSDDLFTDGDPLDYPIEVTMPTTAPGEIVGKFSIGNYDYDSITASGLTPQPPAVVECAGVAGFSVDAGRGQSIAFDVPDALAGDWLVGGGASANRQSQDGLFAVSTETSKVTQVAVDVVAGRKVTAPSASYNAGVYNGALNVDAHRWGPVATSDFSPFIEVIQPPFSEFGQLIMFQWISTVPISFSEPLPVYVDPSPPQPWVFAYQEMLDLGYQSSTANGFAFENESVISLPGALVDCFGEICIQPGPVHAGKQVTLPYPALDFRVADVQLTAPAGSTSISGQGAGSRASTVGQITVSPFFSASTFDGSTAAGDLHLVPGSYQLTSFALDADFNSLEDVRNLDLQDDDEVVSDWAAPMLLAVKPAPGARAGLVPVTGKVQSADPAVTRLIVTVDGLPARVNSDGSFLGLSIVGTLPMTIVARDNLGRTTTLRRYFTSITGLLAPGAGADLVSEMLLQNAIATGNNYVPPLAKNPFKAGRPVALNLSGNIVDLPVTSLIAFPPQLAYIVRFDATRTATAIDVSGQSAANGGLNFHYDAQQKVWTYSLSTKNLGTGTFVIGIRSWDGKRYEAGIVLQ